MYVYIYIYIYIYIYTHHARAASADADAWVRRRPEGGRQQPSGHPAGHLFTTFGIYIVSFSFGTCMLMTYYRH